MHSQLFALPAISTVFQPIVDVTGGRAIGAEALARTADGKRRPEWETLQNSKLISAFDYQCRLSALRAALTGGLDTSLFLNIGAESMCHPHYGALATAADAERLGWRTDRLIFELTEHAPSPDEFEFGEVISQLRNKGARWAVDDWGTGYSRLPLILQHRPDFIKLDRSLSAKIETHPGTRDFVRHFLDYCQSKRIELISEGVEHSGQETALQELGIRLQQGYHHGRPGMHLS